MKRCIALLTLVALSFAIPAPVDAAEIGGWGTVIDPDGDCTIKAGKAGVTFRLPPPRHDLWFGGTDEQTRFNAPRVLQEVEGNFVITVRVTADWKAGIADGGYNGAGLLVWDSEQQYLRHERNRFVTASSAEVSYTTPLYDQNNRRVFYNSTTEDFFQGNSTWLRIARHGDMFVASISDDGQAWSPTGVVSTEFPERVQVGIVSTNSTGRVFAVLFDRFSLTKP